MYNHECSRSAILIATLPTKVLGSGVLTLFVSFVSFWDVI